MAPPSFRATAGMLQQGRATSKASGGTFPHQVGILDG